MDASDLEKMKSNRRKQSKPIRVSYNAENESTEPTFATPDQEEFVNGGNNNEPETSASKDDTPQAVNNVTSMKNPENMHSPTYLEEHIRALAKSVVNPRSEEGFPTEYHRLANELHKFTNGHAERENVPAPDRNGLDTSSRDNKEEGSDGSAKSDGSSRIFHPDAYCEICDREFCNKYFLKTHKANKHGIYENVPSPFPGNALPPSMVLPRESVTPPSFKIENTPFKMECPLSLKMDNLPYKMDNPPFKMDYPSMSPIPPQVPTSTVRTITPPASVQQSLPPFPPPISSTPVKATEINVSTPSDKTVSQDMEDFCDLCQKHFCNKYYLKKHKNDVHGIPPPDGSSVSKRRCQPLIPSSVDSINPVSVSSVVTSSSSLMQQSIANMTGLPHMPGVMVLNPFMPPILVPAQNLLHQSQLPAPPPTSLISQPLAASTLAETAIAPSVSMANSTGPGTVSDVLRGIGVLNAEAYCELCRKEFCNKYFLRIHRANKHGIYDEGSPTSNTPPTPTSVTPSLPTSSSVPNLTSPHKSSIDTHDSPDEYQTSNNNVAEYTTKEIKTEAGTGYKDPKPEQEYPKEVKSEPSPNSRSPLNMPYQNNFANMPNADNYSTYCNLCSQEFSSKYSYRIHRIQIHGMLNEGLLEDMMSMPGMPRGEMSKSSAFPQAFEDKKEEKEVSTMFGTMVAAKLADRVTCDICNKELCNKYFLKAHKYKVHGIDTTVQDKENKSAAQTVETIRNIMKQQEAKQKLAATPKSKHTPILPRTESSKDLVLNTSVEKPSKEELVKLGIDPDAYCEICKKEFCSKYFLRTHKQNIHGIPSGNTTVDADKSGKRTPTKPLNLSNSSNLPTPSPGQINEIFKNGYEKHTWRWKEPVNSSRVTCDLCNKEVCNKYFLRTHMLNKHGILQGNISPTSSEAESNSSQPTDLSMHDRERDRENELDRRDYSNFIPRSEQMSMLFRPRQEDRLQFTPTEDLEFLKKTEDEMSINNRYYNHYTEVCHLCDRRFRSAKWLKAHILKDHAELSTKSPVLDRFFPFSSLGMPLEQRTCQICNLAYPSELSMQLHMIQEHNAQVTLKSDTPPPPSDVQKVSGSGPNYSMKRRFSFAAKQKLYSCGVCNYRTKWLSNLNSHEARKHNMRCRGNKHACNICKKLFSSENSFLTHIQEYHDGDMEQMRDNKVGKKRFRCMSCQQSFLSPIHCHLHIRRVHIRGRTLRKVNQLSAERNLCKLCSYSSRFAKQLQNHMIRVHSGRRCKSTNFHSQDLAVEAGCSGTKSSEPMDTHAQVSENCEGQFVMQAFQLQECCQNSNFVTSVVKMPVRQRVSESVAVTFLLAPAEV